MENIWKGDHDYEKYLNTRNILTTYNKNLQIYHNILEINLS